MRCGCKWASSVPHRASLDVAVSKGGLRCRAMSGALGSLQNLLRSECFPYVSYTAASCSGDSGWRGGCDGKGVKKRWTEVEERRTENLVGEMFITPELVAPPLVEYTVFLLPRGGERDTVRSMRLAMKIASPTRTLPRSWPE
jgi:hypothetical protein